jgi:putative tricarboxylic transport membrane protein
MDIINNVLYGFSIGLQPLNLLFCFFGVLLGTLIGVLPGIGPVGAISILLPATFHMSPTSAIILLGGIYYGAMYGGSTTSILVNIPGEAASVVTCLDGYEMAKRGRAGSALGVAAFGSFIAGTLGLFGLMFFAAPLAKTALKFGYPEYFAITLLGLTLIIYMAQGSLLKGLMMGLLGIILSCVGIDPVLGSGRMTFDVMDLADGIGMVPLAMGLFGISEALVNIDEQAGRTILKTKIKNLFPSFSDWQMSRGPILRGSVLGFLLGVLPGGGPVIASFISYGLEKRLSRQPERFGKGAIEGVAGPEAANNSATSGALVPLFTLGIPANIVIALLMGALVIHGMRPGPSFIKDHPDIFWGVLSSMYIGNVMLLVLNLPLVPMWVQVLRVPYRILFPLILLFCLIGAYALNNNIFDIFTMVIFGLIGYLFRRFGFEGAPLILAFVLGPILELSLRQSLMLSRGSFTIFFTRPISACAVIIAFLVLGSSLVTTRLRRRKERVADPGTGEAP